MASWYANNQEKKAMTRAEIIQNIEHKLERLDVHDELTASALREELDRTGYQLGINGLKSFEGAVDVVLGAFEAV
jgi:hypothetical protein